MHYVTINVCRLYVCMYISWNDYKAAEILCMENYNGSMD